MSVTTSTCRIRRAEEADTPALQRIEFDAARRYGSVEETRFCLDLPVRSIKEHQYARNQGLALVAETEGMPVGFILVIPTDNHAHILEIAVSIEHQGRGCGRALIKAAEEWAIHRGFHEISLTTFRDVAWNAPFYRRLGYDEFQTGPDRVDLRELIAQEKAAGVHAAPRVAMRKMLSAKTTLF